MERLPVLFKRMRDAREKQRNGTFTEELGTILVALLIQHVEEAWHKSIYLRRDAAWVVDTLATLSRLNTHMRDTVRAEHAALTRRLDVDEHGLVRSCELLQPMCTLFELSSSMGRRCYSCATTKGPVLTYFTLLRDDASGSEVSIAVCEDCFNRYTGRDSLGPYDHNSAKSTESYSKASLAVMFGIIQSDDCVVVSTARKIPRKSAGVIVLNKSGLIEAKRKANAKAYRRGQIESRLAADAKLSDAATVAGLDEREAERLCGLCSDCHSSVLDIVQRMSAPVTSVDTDTARLIRLVAKSMYMVPCFIWSKHGDEFVSRAMQHRTRARDLVLEHPSLAEKQLKSTRATMTITGAQLWASQSRTTARHRLIRGEYEVLLELDIKSRAAGAAPFRFVVTVAGFMNALHLRDVRLPPAGHLDTDWVAETQVLQRMVDEMDCENESQDRAQQRRVLTQRVRAAENEQVQRVAELVRRQHGCETSAPNVFGISRHNLWLLAKHTLTRDIMWQIALCTQRVRASTSIRSPITHGRRLK